MKMMLRRVHFMPKNLEPGVLYVSEEFDVAAHLCACGCGEKIRTPLGPTEWEFRETSAGPSLSPSVGNWQKPCKSHYWIRSGQVIWSDSWSEKQILAGRRAEERRRERYYSSLGKGAITKKIKAWVDFYLKSPRK